MRSTQKQQKPPRPLMPSNRKPPKRPVLASSSRRGTQGETGEARSAALDQRT